MIGQRDRNGNERVPVNDSAAGFRLECRRMAFLVSRIALLMILTAAVIGSHRGAVVREVHDRAESSRLRVVTYNIGDTVMPLPGKTRLMEVLGELPPADVYLLQEVRNSGTFRRLVEALSDRRGPYIAAFDADSNLAVVSAFPIERSAMIAGGRALVATIRHDDGVSITVTSVHLPNFRKDRNADGNAAVKPLRIVTRVVEEALQPTIRGRLAEELVEALGEPDWQGLAVVGGDFNTIPLTTAPRAMYPRYRDSLFLTGYYWRGTYGRIDGSIFPRIDYLFHSPEIVVREAYIHSRTAGDHHPVYAEYLLP